MVGVLEAGRPRGLVLVGLGREGCKRDGQGSELLLGLEAFAASQERRNWATAGAGAIRLAKGLSYFNTPCMSNYFMEICCLQHYFIVFSPNKLGKSEDNQAANFPFLRLNGVI